MKLSLTLFLCVSIAIPAVSQDRWDDLSKTIAVSPLREVHETWTTYASTRSKGFVSESMTIESMKENGNDAIVTRQGSNEIRLVLSPNGEFVRLKTTYGDPDLVQSLQADTLILEYQARESALLYQRLRAGKIEETKVQPWGTGWIDFSSLPFLVERLLATGYRGAFSFRTAGQDKSGEMSIRIVETTKPLDRNRLYAFPRAMRDRFGSYRAILVELSASPELKSSYPFPFYYLYSNELKPRLTATWGGNPASPGFHWKTLERTANANGR